MAKPHELTGLKFNRLTVIERNGYSRKEKAWLCKCECGNTVTVGSYKLRTGHTKSCGCARKLAKLIDESGNKYGRLLVTDKFSRNKRGRVVWECLCDCGNKHDVDGTVLRDGRSNSCGCLQRELMSIRSKTHGLTETPAYKSWGQMIQRCTNTNIPAYERYGARGIKVSPEWFDFNLFYADMGDRPEGTSIDRIDNDGDYDPGNCRWATSSEQNQNRSITKLSPESVIQIREMSALGKSNKELSSMFCVESQTINKVVKNESWRNI